MSIANYNKGSINWNVNTEGFEYFSLKELDEKSSGKPYLLRGLFINPHTKYGKQPVAILNNSYANLPKHLLDTVESILKDDDVISQIKAGKAGIAIRSYEDEKNGTGTQYTVDFIDL